MLISKINRNQITRRLSAMNYALNVTMRLPRQQKDPVQPEMLNS